MIMSDPATPARGHDSAMSSTIHRDAPSKRSHPHAQHPYLHTGDEREACRGNLLAKDVSQKVVVHNVEISEI